MPKMVLHLKCIMCTSVSIENQVAKLDEPLKEGLKVSSRGGGGKKLSQGGKKSLNLLSLAMASNKKNVVLGLPAYLKYLWAT